MLTVDAIDHIVLAVRDVEVSAAWYGQVLGMARSVTAPADDRRPRTSMMFGPNKINLRPIAASAEEWFTADTPCAGSADLCFLTDAEPEAVLSHLRRYGVAIEDGPVVKSGARGPVRSVYVRDPDGNLIEISSYG